MKKQKQSLSILSLNILSVIFVWGCQTSKPNLIPDGETVTIQKITADGLAEVRLTNGRGMWPNLERKPAQVFKPHVKTLKMAIIGDTGCRLKEYKDQGEYQNCHDPDLWPMAKISEVIAKDNYDFLVHVGDYYYREKCTNKLFCDKYTDTTGPTWQSWWADFYKPATPLFKKTPILFVRGNHEDCSRGFQGWAALSFKEKEFSQGCEAYEGFQILEWDDLIFINFDNSDFEDKKALKPLQEKMWLERLTELKEALSKRAVGKEVWFLTHKPLFAYLPPDKGDGKITPITSQFKDLVKKSGLESFIDVAVSGHIHSQQVTYFAEGRPQIISGNAGSKLDAMESAVKRPDFYTMTVTHKDFGYALVERLGFKKWKWLFKNVKGETSLTCDFANKKFTCK